MERPCQCAVLGPASERKAVVNHKRTPPPTSARSERTGEGDRHPHIQSRRDALLTIGAAGLAVALLALGVWQLRPGDSDDRPAEAPVASGLGDVDRFAVVSDHVIDEVSYEQTPPVGGPHNPLWLNCGSYDEPIPSENAVHSLEHGAVWITYDPALDAEQVADLKARTPSTYAILSPFPGLPSRVVISAWGRQLRLDSADDPRLGAFIKEFRLGTTAPEAGASCSGASDGSLPLDAVNSM